MLSDNSVVTFRINVIKKVDHPFLKFHKETSLDPLLASINFFFIINSPSCCYNLGVIKTLSLSQWYAWNKETCTVLFHSIVSSFCLIYCDLKFGLFKWSKCKMMTMAGSNNRYLEILFTCK